MIVVWNKNHVFWAMCYKFDSQMCLMIEPVNWIFQNNVLTRFLGNKLIKVTQHVATGPIVNRISFFTSTKSG